MRDEGMVIYFVEMVGHSNVKIGTTNNLPRRMRELRAASAYPQRLLGYIPGGYAKEKTIHNQFSHLRLYGEWFRLDPRLYDFIVDQITDADLDRHIKAEEEKWVAMGMPTAILPATPRTFTSHPVQIRVVNPYSKKETRP